MKPRPDSFPVPRSSFAALLMLAAILALSIPVRGDNWTTTVSGYVGVPAETKVGIGANASNAQLNVASNTVWNAGWRNNLRLAAYDYPAIRFTSTSGNGTTSMIGNNNDGGLYFGTGGVGEAHGEIAMTILGTGRIGIGTTTPANARLEIASPINWSNGWRNNLRLSSHDYPAIRFHTTSGNGTTSMIGNNNDGGLWFGTGGVGDATGSIAMAIMRTGEVGIGVTSPEKKLHVNGDAKISGTLTVPGAIGVGTDPSTDGFAMSATSSSPYKQFRVRAVCPPGQSGECSEPLIKLSGSYYGGNGAEFWQSKEGHVRVNINGGKVGMVISESGNVGVGIGSALPTHSLHVGGAAKFDGHVEVASIKTKTWTVAPDYVFEKDYKLRSLEEVDAFVKKNKHLPEVPSAKAIAKEGLDLAEMNLLLLKKVEELTLHAIRQEKEMKAHKDMMRAQAAEIHNLKAHR